MNLFTVNFLGGLAWCTAMGIGFYSATSRLDIAIYAFIITIVPFISGLAAGLGSKVLWKQFYDKRNRSNSNG